MVAAESGLSTTIGRADKSDVRPADYICFSSCLVVFRQRFQCARRTANPFFSQVFSDWTRILCVVSHLSGIRSAHGAAQGADDAALSANLLGFSAERMGHHGGHGPAGNKHTSRRIATSFPAKK